MHGCDQSPCLSTARLIAVCEKQQIGSFDKRQIPIHVDEHLTMKLQVDDSCLACDHHCCNKKDKIYQGFLRNYQKLTSQELHDALSVSIQQIKEHIPRNIPCIGCRTSIDNFIKSLIEHQHPGLEPLIMDQKGSITIEKSYSSNADNLYILFYIHRAKLSISMENIPKSKKNRRCMIHSLDKTKSLNDWKFVWDVMNKECRDEITLIEANCLYEAIENYLRKYKFCSECRLKVLEAYDLLIDNTDCGHRNRPGFHPALYDGLWSCTNDKHIHIDCSKEFIGSLIARAEVEIQDGRRERHAKTLDVAQEEILTCIGIYLFDKFDKIHRTMRSEEQIWRLMLYIGIDCLRLNFETAIDRKQDFSAALEILCEEFRQADEAKTTKKRSKRKARRANRTAEIKSTTIETNEKEMSINQDYLKIFDIPTRRRTSSCCSCLCHYCDARTDSLSIMQTTLSKASLVKSQSCPSALLFIAESIVQPADSVLNTKKTIPLSGSLETLFSSVSNRECVCHEKTLEEQQVLCDECPASSSTNCIRCFSTRTDLGYASGQDETCSSVLCECSSAACDGCSTELSHCCPLHEEDESSVFSHNCRIHDVITDYPKMIELYDRTRKHKLKLQLSREYPFFDMDLKSTWEENCLHQQENQVFISDADLQRFTKRNKNLQHKRAQLREKLKLKFHTWKHRQSSKAS